MGKGRIHWNAKHKKMVHLNKNKIKQYKKDKLTYCYNSDRESGREIEETKVLSVGLGEKILQAADEFNSRMSEESQTSR